MTVHRHLTSGLMDGRLTTGATRTGRRITLALAPVFLCSSLFAQASSPSITKELPVRVAEAQANNEHGLTTSDCVIVMPDGRFHVERLRQVLPSSTATLNIFESSLDSSQLQQLGDIVAEAEASRIPAYDSHPVGFTNAPWFSSVIVSVGEGQTARKFGYWEWDRRNTGPDVPADVKKHWHDSETALQPLVEWLHAIEAMKLPPSNAEPTKCSTDEPR